MVGGYDDACGVGQTLLCCGCVADTEVVEGCVAELRSAQVAGMVEHFVHLPLAYKALEPGDQPPWNPAHTPVAEAASQHSLQIYPQAVVGHGALTFLLC